MAVTHSSGAGVGGGIATEMQAFMEAIRRLESGSYGGNYSAQGPLVKSGQYAGERAHGAYQIMPGNWASWAKAAGLPANAPKTKANQDRVAAHIMGGYFKKYKRWDAVAVAWFAGPSRADRYIRGEGLGGINDGSTSVPSYVTQIGNYMRNSPTAKQTGITIQHFGGSPGGGVGSGGGNIDRELAMFIPGGGGGGTGTLSDFDLGGMNQPYQAPREFQQFGPGGTSPTGTGLGGGSQAAAGIPGVGSGGPVSKQDLKTFIQTVYPQMLWAIDHKELGPILQKAASEGWDQARLFGSIIGTDWWKTNPESGRVLENIKQNDPATYRQMLNQRARDIITEARQLGWNLSVADARDLAGRALSESWTPAQTLNELMAVIPIDAAAIERGEVGGRAAQAFQAIENVSNAYLMNLTDKEKNAWVRGMLDGTKSEDAFRNFAQNQAKIAMPWLKDILDQGFTPLEGLSNQRNHVADMLEVQTEAVDLRRDEYQQLFTVKEGDRRRLATTAETRRNVMELMPDRWDKTNKAQQNAMGMAQQIGQMFGVRA